MIHKNASITTLCIILFAASSANGQFGNNPPASQKHRWKIGLEVTAQSAPCAGIIATIPIPTAWPEQSVRIVDRNVSPHFRAVRFRKSKDGFEQMLLEMGRLPVGDKASAVMIFEIEKRAVTAPEDPSALVIPKRAPRDARKTLGASPYIETRDGRIRSKARELTMAHSKAWDKAKALYDFVRDEIKLDAGKLKGASATLKSGSGQKEDIANLFIALCRSSRIPARTVWVANHSYAEFYLADAKGEGKWYPCEMAGQRHFGHMPDYRPILLRGDSFTTPENKKPQRFVTEFVKGKAGRGFGPPKVRFIRELLPAQ